MTSTRSLLTLQAQSAFQAPRDDTYNPECTHNPMAIQCNQYPNPSHSSALPQFLAHHNCEDLASTDTPSAVPTTLQAPKHCTHNPSTSQIKKSNHTNPMAIPYPPDPGEHVMERSATPTALVERDKLDPSSLAPPKGEMESSFSWTYLFKNPTSSTLCFGEPTLKKLNQVKLTGVWILQGIYPLKDEWVFGCSLKTRLADQTKTQQLKWLWSKDSMNSTINQRLVEQTQEMNFKLEGSGGSTLDDTLRKQYLSSSDE